MKAILIKTDFEDIPSFIEFNSDNELNTYHKYIGCTFTDTTTLWYDGERYSIDCVVDDEGMLNSSKMNERFWWAHRKGYINYNLFGNVIIVMTDRFTGETVDLDTNFVIKILCDNCILNNEDIALMRIK